jgi:hypothetical protein
MKILYAGFLEEITKKSFYSQNVIRWQQSAISPDLNGLLPIARYTRSVFRNERLLHRAGEASEILALTRNREQIDNFSRQSECLPSLCN